MTMRLGVDNRQQSGEVGTFPGSSDLSSRHRSRPRQVADSQQDPRLGIGLHHGGRFPSGVSGSGDALDGCERGDAYLDTLARMCSFEQGQEVPSQQPEIAGYGSFLPHPVQSVRHLVNPRRSQS
jgi:hypothetical protein